MDSPKEAPAEAPPQVTKEQIPIREKEQASIEGKEEESGPPKMSKGAIEKARKKAEKAQKKKEQASRPKEPKATPTTPAAPVNMFAEGWLKRVYEEKPGPVRTRFPPEPNGFLHLGHSKSIALNFGLAKYHGGICFLRYDDTNPSAEKEEYFTSIRDIVEWLGYTPYQITYSSDHFDRLYGLAEELIRRDKAYVCHCSREETNKQRGGPDNRGPRYGCSHRERSTKESLTEFRQMRDGKYKPGEAYLRMKQKITDPNEGNPQMWDLPAYRIVEDNFHVRTGNSWKIYPTYDFTHCLCDAFEGITLSLCTSEFRTSRVSYDWLLEVLDMKIPNSEELGPTQREFGRLNIVGTILSKRRIQMLVTGTTVEKRLPDGTVEKKVIPPTVRGWDDPRLFTLVAIRRRGVPARAILNFVEELGVTDATTEIEVTRFESTIRKYLERTAPRLSLVLDPIRVIIEDFTEADEQDLDIPYDPKGQISGSRSVKISREIFISADDFIEVDNPNFFRLAPGKIVGLLNAVVIRATSFSKDDNGRITEIRAVKVEGEKPKAYIHWVDTKTGVRVNARQYSPLFHPPPGQNPNSLDWKEGGWADYLNPNSEVSHKNAVIEKGIEDLIAGHDTNPSGSSDDLVRFQAMRTAYFCIDPEKNDDGSIVLNQIVTLKEDKGK